MMKKKELPKKSEAHKGVAWWIPNTLSVVAIVTSLIALLMSLSR